MTDLRRRLEHKNAQDTGFGSTWGLCKKTLLVDNYDRYIEEGWLVPGWQASVTSYVTSEKCALWINSIVTMVTPGPALEFRK